MFWEGEVLLFPELRSNPKKWTEPGCFTLGARYSGLKRSALLLLTKILPEVPNNLNAASSDNITVAHCSLVHSLYSYKQQTCPLCFFCLIVVSLLFSWKVDEHRIVSFGLHTDLFPPIRSESVRELRLDDDLLYH